MCDSYHILSCPEVLIGGMIDHHGYALQDVSFHQCVNLGRYNTEKVVSFVPPDGEFELMKYRCNENISLPFRVLPVINELGRTRLEVKVAVKSAFNDKLFALNVVLTIPMPDNTARADIQPSQGGEQGGTDSSCMGQRWSMRLQASDARHIAMQGRQSMMPKSMPWSGRSSALMGSGNTHFQQVLSGWQPPERKSHGEGHPSQCHSRRVPMCWQHETCAACCQWPVRLKKDSDSGLNMQVPMFSSSGLRVQYLKVWEKSSYKVDKWVRKVSKSGEYQIRTQ